MNDEFAISYTIIDGSEGGLVETYYLTFEKHCTDISEMSFEEIVRLKDFLMGYINKKGGNNDSK